MVSRGAPLPLGLSLHHPGAGFGAQPSFHRHFHRSFTVVLRGYFIRRYQVLVFVVSGGFAVCLFGVLSGFIVG